MVYVVSIERQRQTMYLSLSDRKNCLTAELICFSMVIMVSKMTPRLAESKMRSFATRTSGKSMDEQCLQLATRASILVLSWTQTLSISLLLVYHQQHQHILTTDLLSKPIHFVNTHILIPTYYYISS